MLSAGTCVEWLRDDLGLIASADESAIVAAQCETTGDVWFVPALLGLGTPVWDFGARGTLVGLTRGSGRPEVVRAVLEGVAHRGADLVEASEARQRLSDRGAARRRWHVGQPGLRAGAGRRHRAPGRGLAGARGDHARRRTPGRSGHRHLRLDRGAGRTFSPRHTVDPANDDLGRAAARERWLAARAKAEATIPDLSGLSF